VHSLLHSRRRRALRLGATFALASALMLSTLGATPSAQAVPSPSAPAPQGGTGAGEGPDLSDLLGEPTPGPEALELLDRPSLREVAEHNGLSLAELRSDLESHDTLQVTPAGDLLFVDPAAPAHLRDASTSPDDHDHSIDGDQDQGPDKALLHCRKTICRLLSFSVVFTGPVRNRPGLETKAGNGLANPPLRTLVFSVDNPSRFRSQVDTG
jgi:hypothetical protein